MKDVRRGKILTELVKKYGFKKGAELGVWHGHTFMYLVENNPDLHMIGVDSYIEMPNNIGEGKEQYIKGQGRFDWDHEKHYKNVMNFCSKYPDRTKFIRDFTYNACKEIEDESLDFVFIDADHSEEGVRRDINDWSPKVKTGGIISGHDYNKSWPGVVKVVNEIFGKNNITLKPNFVWCVQKQ